MLLISAFESYTDMMTSLIFGLLMLEMIRAVEMNGDVVLPLAGMAGCPTIVSRADWGAKPPKDREDMKTPVPFVIIHHTALDECFDYDACGAEMRKIQELHQVQRNWSDIGYNFCVGEDGRVYQGRGWDTVGAQAPGYNNKSIGICVMGNYMEKVPNNASIQAVFSLIACAVENGKLAESYILYGHRQVRDTLCPGDDLFEEIQSWPHWKPGKHYPPGRVDGNHKLVSKDGSNDTDSKFMDHSVKTEGAVV